MIILASKSPRRKELLSFITDDFKVDSADVDETLPQNIKPDKALNIYQKSKQNLSEAVIILLSVQIRWLQSAIKF